MAEHKFSRRAAIAAGTLGAVAAATEPLSITAHEQIAANLLVLPPHWLDPVIGDGKDADAIVGRLVKDKTFQQIIAAAVKGAAERPPEPGIPGPTYAQIVRMGILDGFRDGVQPSAKKG